jgi:hypothetical protein
MKKFHLALAFVTATLCASSAQAFKLNLDFNKR